MVFLQLVPAIALISAQSYDSLVDMGLSGINDNPKSLFPRHNRTGCSRIFRPLELANTWDRLEVIRSEPLTSSSVKGGEQTISTIMLISTFYCGPLLATNDKYQPLPLPSTLGEPHTLRSSRQAVYDGYSGISGHGTHHSGLPGRGNSMLAESNEFMSRYLLV